jgi:TPR repeat protein
MVQFVEDRSCITQFELGEMFQKDDRSRDYGAAFKWYMQSAQHGYRRAQHQLGTMYARGTGVTRNYIKAVPGSCRDNTTKCMLLLSQN